MIKYKYQSNYARHFFLAINVYANLWIDAETTNNGMQHVDSQSFNILICVCTYNLCVSTLMSIGFVYLINPPLHILLQASTKVERPTTRKQTRGAAPLRSELFGMLCCVWCSQFQCELSCPLTNNLIVFQNYLFAGSLHL